MPYKEGYIDGYLNKEAGGLSSFLHALNPGRALEERRQRGTDAEIAKKRQTIQAKRKAPVTSWDEAVRRYGDKGGEAVKKRQQELRFAGVKSPEEKDFISNPLNQRVYEEATKDILSGRDLDTHKPLNRLKPNTDVPTHAKNLKPTFRPPSHPKLPTYTAGKRPVGG
jgi:hypothetical protein